MGSGRRRCCKRARLDGIPEADLAAMAPRCTIDGCISLHMFVRPLALSVPVGVARGPTGTGSISKGFLDEDVLAYLQNGRT